MEAKPEAASVAAAPKPEPQTPQAQKGNKFQQGGSGGPNMQKKKAFVNRGGKMGPNQQENNRRGPMKNEVSEKISNPQACTEPPFYGENLSDVALIKYCALCVNH